MVQVLQSQADSMQAHVVRSVPVAWYGVASEVLLMGSFDGWTQGITLSAEDIGDSVFTKFQADLQLLPVDALPHHFLHWMRTCACVQMQGDNLSLHLPPPPPPPGPPPPPPLPPPFFGRGKRTSSIPMQLLVHPTESSQHNHGPADVPPHVARLAALILARCPDTSLLVCQCRFWPLGVSYLVILCIGYSAA